MKQNGSKANGNGSFALLMVAVMLVWSFAMLMRVVIVGHDDTIGRIRRRATSVNEGLTTAGR